MTADACEAEGVIGALAWVQSRIGGIEKAKPNKAANEGDRVFYAYRGIDQIAAAAQPLLGQAGVVIVPTEATITSIEQIVVNGKPWTDTMVSVSWTIYGPGGVSDCITSVTQGIGRDNSDKGYNKAATQAFKNLLLRILCIGDPQDDADAPQHQGNATDVAPEEFVPSAVELVKAIADAPDDVKDAVKKYAKGRRVTARYLSGEPTFREALAVFFEQQMAAHDHREEFDLSESVEVVVEDGEVLGTIIKAGQHPETDA